MPYVGSIYRPPSEANSFILQVTVGCSHHKCTFCGSFLEKRFRLKQWSEIEADIRLAQRYYGSGVARVFLADGNALTLSTRRLLEFLDRLNQAFPSLKRVGVYGTPRDVLRKTPDDLQVLRKAGLGIVYMGVETGDEELLKDIRKGVSIQQMIEAGRRVVESGIALSPTVIAGLGGPSWSERHARRTAELINAIDPPYLGVLTLMIEEGTPMAEEVRQGRRTLLTPLQVLQEIRILVAGLKTSRCIFRANHASNYLSLKGVLADERDRVLQTIDRVMAGGTGCLRPEGFRAL